MPIRRAAGASGMDAAKRVAVIGAGPGGIAAARWLLARGFEPEVFEATAGLGGQWRWDSPASGVWRDMHANTSRVVTRFSDLDHGPETPVFPHNREVLAYLEDYAARFAVAPRIRTSSPVEALERSADGGWTVRWREAGGERRQRFARVVVASGRFRRPVLPDIPGLDAFDGAGGVTHTFRYKQPVAYRGLRVLVLGGAISALEVASDLAMSGAARVVVAQRRQRYVMPKLVGGAPSDHRRFTRFGALAAESLPPDLLAARMKALLMAAVGDPSQYGAPSPAADIRTGGIALSQYYLPLVAEGRIAPRPWVEAISGRTAQFAGGGAEDFDAIVAGTGYQLDLGYLGEGIRAALDLDARHIDLSDATFHPKLPGLAFVGFYAQSGPYFPVLELQARLIAYSWSGACAAPTDDALEAGVAAYRARRGLPQDQQMHILALRFARLAGVEPDLATRPDIARALLFGPLTPASFRLDGPDPMHGAAEEVAAQAALLGAITGPDFTEDERGRLAEVGAAGDSAAARALAGVAP